MKFKHVEFTIKQLLFLIIYKVFLVRFPSSTTIFIGKYCKKIRYLCCKNIFLYCGENVNIEKGAYFGTGFRLKIGHNSGLGLNCFVPGDIEIGNDVMMGPECHILSSNHSFDRLDIPMMKQGNSTSRKTIINDDVWIGRQVIFTPGRLVKKGTIIGAGTVLTKDFPEYSVVAGNSSRLIKNRLDSSIKSKL